MKLKEMHSNFREVEKVDLWLKNQTFGFHAKEQVYEMTILSEDYVDRTIRCISHACAGSSGYSIYSIVLKATCSPEGYAEGDIKCDGRESGKTTSLGCTGHMFYKVRATFR